MQEDPASCVNEAPIKWPALAGAMYPVILEPTRVCTEIRVCEPETKPTNMDIKRFSCDECTSGVYELSSIFVHRETVIEMMEFLKGDGYCAATEDPAGCHAKVEAGLLSVMPMLSETTNILAPSFCCSL